jgi:hypothetical protein
MNFSFGIITSGKESVRVQIIINSIRKQKIPNYEIIIVGGNNDFIGDDIVHISFDESITPMWITKKKNLITKNSKYENLVFLHDYIVLNDGWYDGHLKSGDNFHIKMDKIINFDGTRFRDWCLWPHNYNFMDSLIGKKCLIPYNMSNLSKYMYISGSYWVCKKYVMEKFPLNENLIWGQGEDVEWSKIVREVYEFKMNQNSSVSIIKPGKDRAFDETDNELNKKLYNIPYE